MNITIPPEALEKAAKELRKFRMQKFRMGDTASVKWDELNNYAKEYWLSQTRAACLALINNWPGMEVFSIMSDGEESIVLPIPQEDGNERE